MLWYINYDKTEKKEGRSCRQEKAVWGPGAICRLLQSPPLVL